MKESFPQPGNIEKGKKILKEKLEQIKRKGQLMTIVLASAFSAISCGMQQNIPGQHHIRQPFVNEVGAAGAAAAQNAMIDGIRAADNINATYNRQVVHQYQVNSALMNSASRAASQRIDMRRAAFR